MTTKTPTKDVKEPITKSAKQSGQAKKTPLDLKSGKFAVIETGSKQYKIVEGQILNIEKLPNTAEGKPVIFDKVLMINDGTKVTVGTPYIKGAKIEANFEKEGLGKKITVIRFRAKSRYSKKKGHRQPFSQVTISSIK